MRRKTDEQIKENNKIRQKRYRDNNVDKLKIYSKKSLKEWEGFIPLETSCQICDKKIYFNRNNAKDAIHFDHKYEDVLIKGSPTEWLRKNKHTPKNEKIWRSCKFGMLCKNCNLHLPNIDRYKIVIRILRYVLC